MNKPQITTTAAILFAVATMGIGLANAQGSASSEGANPPQRSFGQAQHERMNQVLEATDYASFVDEVGTDAKILDVITEDNFGQFLKMHELMQSGDLDGAKTIADELDMPYGMKDMRQDGRGRGAEGMGQRGGNRGQLSEEERTAVDAAMESGDYQAFIKAHGADSDITSRVSEEQFKDMVTRHKENETRRDAVQASIDARDYDSFVKAVGTDAPFLNQVNETNFAQFAEMHDLRQAGDVAGANTIAEELGISVGPKNGQGAGMGIGMKGGRGMHDVRTL